MVAKFGSIILTHSFNINELCEIKSGFRLQCVLGCINSVQTPQAYKYNAPAAGTRHIILLLLVTHGPRCRAWGNRWVVGNALAPSCLFIL